MAMNMRRRSWNRKVYLVMMICCCCCKSGGERRLLLLFVCRGFFILRDDRQPSRVSSTWLNSHYLISHAFRLIAANCEAPLGDSSPWILQVKIFVGIVFSVSKSSNEQITRNPRSEAERPQFDLRACWSQAADRIREGSKSLMRKVNLMLHPYTLHGDITLDGRPFPIAAMRIRLQGADVSEGSCERIWILGLLLPARNCCFEEGGIYLTGWGRVSRFEKRLRKEATHDMINAVVIVNSNPSCWTRKRAISVLTHGSLDCTPHI